MRRMPIIFLVDTSGRMQGERIKTATTCLQGVIHRLQQDPDATETANISVATFNMQFVAITEQTDIKKIKVPKIDASPSTPAMLGNAISCLADWLKPRITGSTEKETPIVTGNVILFWGGGLSDPLEFEKAVKKIEVLPVNVTVISINCSQKHKLPDSWQNIFYDLHTTNQILESLRPLFKSANNISNAAAKEPASLYLPPLPKEIII